MGLHVGLIGSGSAGKAHIGAVISHPAVSSLSLAENDLVQLDSLAKTYRLRYVTQNYQKLLIDPEIDIIDICLSHDLHYPIALQAFQAGKDVIVEKPISNSIEEADAMIAASKQFGKRLYVALNERFLPVHQKVKEIIQSGKLGKVVLANLIVAGSELDRMDAPDHWKGTFGRAGGGALADSGTHVVDLAIDWFGMPDAVQSSMGRFIVGSANKAEDTASLTMLYPS
jgi:UDP-N-acetylglucosamine 3-dehydrogenase